MRIFLCLKMNFKAENMSPYKGLGVVLFLLPLHCSTNNKLHIASCYVWRNGQGLPQLQSRLGINLPEKRKLRRVYRRIKNDFDIIK